MPIRSPIRPSGSDSDFVLRLPQRSLRVFAGSIAAGLLLFLVVWLSSRDDGFYQPPAKGTAVADANALPPLPEPLPAGGDGASDMPDAPGPAPARDEAAVVENPPEPGADDAPVALDETQPADLPAGEAGPSSITVTAGQQPLAPGDRPVPLASNRPPRYPPDALRNGQGGTVLVRIEVDATGAPAGVAMLQRSGNRDLDRAAMEAVRGWRYQPAQRDGQPVAASLTVPIEFAPNR